MAREKYMLTAHDVPARLHSENSGTSGSKTLFLPKEHARCAVREPPRL